MDLLSGLPFVVERDTPRCERETDEQDYGGKKPKFHRALGVLLLDLFVFLILFLAAEDLWFSADTL